MVALGLVFTYLHPALAPAGLYGTLLIMALGMMVGYLPFATRVMNGSLTQIHKELEEAGEASGANRLQILWQITFPLIRPPFIAAWIWVAAHTMRAFAIPLMLASRQNQTLSVLLWQYWDDENNLSMASALGVLFALGLACLTFSARAVIIDPPTE